MIIARNSHIIKLIISGLFLLISGIMLFTKLGNYALWDDETMVTLAARGIIETGDTTAVHGKNVVAFREGFVLRGLADRSTPPLSSYVGAASIRFFGASPFAARIPFAIMGFCLMMLAVFVLLRSKVSIPALIVCFTAILGHASLMLFLRQCRYYAPVILVSTAIILVYLQWKKNRVQLVGVSILFVLLFYILFIFIFIIIALLFFFFFFFFFFIPSRWAVKSCSHVATRLIDTSFDASR